MKTSLRRWPLLLLAVLALVALAFTPLAGCVASAGAYVGDGEYYYDAPGYVVYDGWGPTYHVGPPRGDHDHDGHHDDHHDDHHDGHAGRPPAYHPAPPSHAVPSIPTQSHPAPRGH